MSVDVGYAAGCSWSSTPDAFGMYQWSAFGPSGGQMSHAATAAEAEARAKAARDRLSLVPPLGPALDLRIDHASGVES